MSGTKCEVCGNVAKNVRTSEGIRVILVRQCDGCKQLICSECLVEGTHEENIAAQLREMGMDITAYFCPNCNYKVLS